MDARNKSALKTLQTQFAELKVGSSDRVEEIKSLVTASETLKGPDAPKQLLGRAVFFKEKIGSEYTWLNPTGSRLYSDLESKILKDMDPKQQLISLAAHYPIAKSEAKDAEDFDYQFGNLVDGLLKKVPDLKHYLTLPPAEETFIREVEALPGKYEAYYSSNSSYINTTTSDHMKYAALLKILTLDRTTDFLFPLTSGSAARNRTKKYSFYFGALLWIASNTKTEGSELSKMCRNALNITSVKEVPEPARLFLYSTFLSYLKMLQKNEVVLELLKSLRLFKPNKLSEWVFFQTGKFDDAEVFLESLVVKITTYTNSQSFLRRCAESASTAAVWGAFAMACYEIAMVAYGLGLGKGVGVRVMGGIGKFVAGYPGQFIGAYIGGKYEKESVFPAACATGKGVLTLRDWYYGEENPKLEEAKVAEEFKDKVEETVFFENDKAMSEKGEMEYEQYRAKVNFIEALIALPSASIVTLELKIRLKKIFGDLTIAREEREEPVKAAYYPGENPKLADTEHSYTTQTPLPRVPSPRFVGEGKEGGNVHHRKGPR